MWSCSTSIPTQKLASDIALLERVIAGYHLTFAAMGVELAVPRQRLVSAWFRDQKNYLDFLRSEDATAFATTRGYYHPTWKAVVAYDARSNESQVAARKKLAWQRDELERYTEMVDQAPRGAGSRSSWLTSHRGR